MADNEDAPLDASDPNQVALQAAARAARLQHRNSGSPNSGRGRGKGSPGAEARGRGKGRFGVANQQPQGPQYQTGQPPAVVQHGTTDPALVAMFQQQQQMLQQLQIQNQQLQMDIANRSRLDADRYNESKLKYKSREIQELCKTAQKLGDGGFSKPEDFFEVLRAQFSAFLNTPEMVDNIGFLFVNSAEKSKPQWLQQYQTVLADIELINLRNELKEQQAEYDSWVNTPAHERVGNTPELPQWSIVYETFEDLFVNPTKKLDIELFEARFPNGRDCSIPC